MNYISWSLVKVLHEKRVNEGLRAGCINTALRTAKSERHPSTKRNLGQEQKTVYQS
jgi:hypothetical protein